MAYLVGVREFMGHRFEVSPDVLIPRPETELLVELVLKSCLGMPQPRVLDLGTGSGAVAISVALARPDAMVVASDQSAAALSVAQSDVTLSGHAIECRINAEDPRTFVPSPGTITHFHAPGGLGVRVDSGAYAGYKIPPYYDSMIAKLIVYGRTREGCIMRLRRALEEMVVEGVKTNIPLHQELLRQDDVLNGDYSIKWLENWLDERAV